MTLPASDAFTAAADAALTTYSANWTLNAGALAVNAAGDYCYPNSLGAESAAHWNADTFGADQYAECAITNTNNDCQVGPAVRCAASGATYYGLYWGPNYGTPTVWLFKQVGGAWTELGSAGLSMSAGDTLRLEISGTTLTPLRNGSLITALGTKTDSSISSGYAGICGYSQSVDARLDNWQGGNIGAAAVDIVVAQVLRPRRHPMIDSWR